MKIYATLLVFFLGLIYSAIFISCNNLTNTANTLSKTEIDYIKKLGILENNETIILFETQGAFGNIKVSGNFFTEKRIASYWIDKNDTNNSHIDFAYYSDIDTITIMPLTTSLTYASYLEVIKMNGQKFKVYVDADSAETWNFFNSAIAEWAKNNTLDIIVETSDSIILPQLKGIEVFLENNTDKAIKIWEKVPPSGKMELYFTIQTNDNRDYKIETIILNWNSNFSKIIQIEPHKKYKLETNITHWVINNDELSENNFVIEGKLRAIYTSDTNLVKNIDHWKGEISSDQNNVIIIK